MSKLPPEIDAGVRAVLADAAPADATTADVTLAALTDQGLVPFAHATYTREERAHGHARVGGWSQAFVDNYDQTFRN